MSYGMRVSLMFLADSLVVSASIFLAALLANNYFEITSSALLISSLTLLITYHVLSYIYKLYKKAWEYASIGEFIIVLKTITLSVILTVIFQFIILHEIYLRVVLVTWMIHISLIGCTRMYIRAVKRDANRQAKNRKKALIIGAGSAGMMVARHLLFDPNTELTPVAFIDDDVRKHHLQILGISVIGGREKIEKAVQKYNIDHIVIAIPSLNKNELNKILQECAKTGKKTQTIPKLEDIMTGKISVSHFRDVQVEDLLGREPVELDMESISAYVANKVILITGAGGSIGSEICRQLCKFNPSKLILLGHGENSIYTIKTELENSFGNMAIEFCTEIADIQDAEKMVYVMNKHRPNVVYHAAAHKHVPLMEQHPDEAVKNNILGTINVANAAKWNQAEVFVMISTDKAVNPTSVMGATKRLAEILIQEIDRESDTKFVAVRFGNVLGSRGSVIPLFKKQIQKGGPVTVTHPNMTRYFMTIPEASRLVIQAGALAKGGEIFVLDMGEPIKIVDLAKNLIHLSGSSVEDIGIKFTGVRPGEKLFEELLNPEEIYEQQIYPKIHIGKSLQQDTREITKFLKQMDTMNHEEIKEKLLQLANHRMSRSKLVNL